MLDSIYPTKMYKVVILSFFTQSVYSQFFPIYFQCTSHVQCPPQSGCRADACNGYRCLCDEGYAASNDLRTCLTAGNHSDACDDTVRCLGGIYALCRNNTCMCTELARVTHINTCVSKGSARVVGATCSTQDTCVTNAECRGGTCQCKAGYRKKSTREFWVDPESRDHCVLQDYSLDSCNGVPLPTTTGPPTTTTITTTTSTTTTPTTTTTTATTTTTTMSTTTLTTTTTPTTTTTMTTTSLTTVDTTLKIFSNCTTTDQCPVGSTCRANECYGYNCLCDWGYTASEDRTACLTAGFLSSDCSSPTVKCLSPLAECKAGVCSCSDVYRTTPYNSCTFKGARVLGEGCQGEDQCGVFAECSLGYCQCASGFRVKTPDEFWADPESLVQCLPGGFSLYTCDQDQSLYTTTPAPTTTTSTTTTTVPTTTDPSATTTTPGSTTVTQVVNIFENCTSNSRCPLRASCRPNGCLGYTCLCDWGYAPSDDRTTCLSAGNVGATCQDGIIQCLSPLASCVDGICDCVGDYRPTAYNTCTFPGSRVLYEVCTVGSTECGVLAECTSGICECTSGSRTKTTEEFWADPDSLVQCVPEGFSLYACTSILPTVSIPSTSPTTTTSTSTLTTAVTTTTSTPNTTTTKTIPSSTTSSESTTISTSTTTTTTTAEETTSDSTIISTTTNTLSDSSITQETTTSLTTSTQPTTTPSTQTTTTTQTVSSVSPVTSRTTTPSSMTTTEEETTSTTTTSTTETSVSTSVSSTTTPTSSTTVESSTKPSTTAPPPPTTKVATSTTTMDTETSETTPTATSSTTTAETPTSQSTIHSSTGSTLNTGVTGVSSNPQREEPVKPVNNEDGSKVAVIASACTAGFVLLIIIAVIVLLCHRRHRYKRRLEVTNDHTVLRTYDNVELPSAAAAYMVES